MSSLEFPNSVELLTSSTGGSIHIIRFHDQNFFKLFRDQFIKRISKKLNSSLEFCYLESDGYQEEVLLVQNNYIELHFHGGVANLEHVVQLLHKLPNSTYSSTSNISEAWYRLYREVKSEKSINYLLSIRQRALSEDQTLLNDESQYDIEGYDFLKPVKIMLIGPPNAGKSTLFNYLVGEQRALISEIEGTTRDILSATLTFGGYEVVIMDTAGLREKILSEGTQFNDQSIQTHSENLVLNLMQSTDLFCVFNTPNPPTWIPEEKTIHLQSKAELNPKAYPRALSFSIHQDLGCQELLQAITEKIKTLKQGKVSTHFFANTSS